MPSLLRFPAAFRFYDFMECFLFYRSLEYV
ncbi:hypothetical protein LSH36_334g03022 [Paralvinella palmiformis]|uniref:Uncharacterized protein n=1 Tax=Paralvinella palmiformis TaxID=53620 RepID=A0AAD9N0H5_9ANNE|nr:hypothetical protein LSH36_334g03022 [Paralvinella palmiformis]